MATIASDAMPLSCKEALRKLKLINPRNDGPDSDPWAGYVEERNLILRLIRDRAMDNVIILSGDVHVSLAAEISCPSAGEPQGPVAVELVTPSITSQNLDDKMGWAPRTESPAIEQALVESLPSLRWCELDSHGYVIVDVRRERVLAEWWFVDAVHTPAAGETCAAAWKVESGRSNLTEVSR
jgi:alkaline phosphatase D